MFTKPSINDTPKPTAIADSLQELVVNLDEHNEELVTGGAKEKFIRSKPHVNSSPYDGLVMVLGLLFANPFSA
ncbi:MAG: hypothetical protein AB1589_07875 [Cyanobacteriota bacterium]